MMLRTPTFVMAVVLGGGAIGVQPSFPVITSAAFPRTASADATSGRTGQSPQPAALKMTAAPAADIPFHDDDFQAEQELLELANQARAQAGAPPLALDSGLSRAALIHAQAMLDARQLSHQFQGEPSLVKRLAAATKLQLEQEGENVAFDYDARSAQQHLMLSPPHRANLLNPDFNVVGLSALRIGDQIYVVQDFGRALPNYSADEVKGQIAAAMAQMRRRVSLQDLVRRDRSAADAAACSMARADKLATSPIHELAQRYTVLTYTTLHPDTLPAGANRAIGSRTVRTFSTGVCYARTVTYPTGVYWVVLALD